MRVLAWLSAVPYKHPNYMAVGLKRYGKGWVAAFAYDLAETLKWALIVLTLREGEEVKIEFEYKS